MTYSPLHTGRIVDGHAGRDANQRGKLEVEREAKCARRRGTGF